MSAWIDWEPLCGIAASMESGGPALNVGDTAGNDGVGASIPVLCSGGFLGGFASSSSNGASARLFTLTIGPDKVVAFGRDEREWGQIGDWANLEPPTFASPLPTDRYIVAYGSKSNLQLRTGGIDTIGLYGDGSDPNRPQVVVDASGQTVKVQVGGANGAVLTLSATQLLATVGGAASGASLTMTPTSITLELGGKVVFSISGAVVSITGIPPLTATLEVNGVPVTVP